MARPPAAQISHLSARRLRIRVPERRRDTAFFATAAERISAWTDVERVETNPLTAGILIHCSDTQKLLAEAVAEKHLFEIDFDKALNADQDKLVDRAARTFDATDAALLRWTEGQVDIRAVLFVVFLLGGIYQLFRGVVGAPAPTLLWRAGDVLGLWDGFYRNSRGNAAAHGAAQTPPGSPPARTV
jgi:hypothetical protein